MKIKNILIIGHSNIGDVCYDLALVNPLQTHFPQAKISFLTSSRAENLIREYTGIRKIFFSERKGVLGTLRLIRSLRKERFNLAIVLKNSLIYKFLGIPGVWRAAPFARGRKRHIVEAYRELLGSQGLEVKDIVFNFGLPGDARNYCDKFFRKHFIAPGERVAGILPIAAWSLKSWPIEKWNELARILRERYSLKAIAFGKSGNDPFSREVLANMSKDIISAIDKTTLTQARALIKRCSLFIAPDSSLLHLASCMGVESIGLYGPTSPEYLYPYFHQQNVIVSKAGLDCCPCSPGLKSIPCKKEFQAGACMEGVSVEDVIMMITQRLNLPV